jgi:urease accessory protein
MSNRSPDCGSTLLMVSERLSGRQRADAQLVLPFELRSRSRFRARLSSGEEVGVVLSRGQVLRGGDLLRAADGRVVEVAAAAEPVSTVHDADPGALARAAYHLGNRHVALQIGDRWLRYLHDHVLDEMVRGLGLHVHLEQAPFEPESGAYSTASGAAAAHSHAHGHAPAQGHAQDHHSHD